MTSKLPPSASVATASEAGKLCAPAATRNAEAICALVRDRAPASGAALELASGTGQHIVALAHACPGLDWQPTEVDAARLASIDAYRTEVGLPNIAPALRLDATASGWSSTQGGKALILLVNLLHLISEPAARRVVTEAVSALAPKGRFILYGPFMRGGRFTSEGDARFHSQLSGADPAIGYKDDTEIDRWLRDAGASLIEQVEMPANNLAFVAAR